MGWLPLRLQNTIGGGIPGMEPMLFGITNDHSNYMQRPKRGSTRKWENRSLKVDLSLMMGWLPFRLQDTNGGGIPGMEPMLFRIASDHYNYMQRPMRDWIRKWANHSLEVNLSCLTKGWLPLRLQNTNYWNSIVAVQLQLIFYPAKFLFQIFYFKYRVFAMNCKTDMEKYQIFQWTRFVNNQNFRKKYVFKFLTITRIIVEIIIYRL